MTDRKFRRWVAAVWAGTSLLMILIGWTAIATWRFPDPDDQMRLLEVRDWLGGQSWFDVAQYRLNVPQGVPMHWSRIVDVPIAAVILLTRPLLGTTGAEHVALVAVPLLTLGAVMALVAAIARKMLDAEQALFAVLLVPMCVEVMHQLRPMRVDHHGWQIALGLAAALALLDTNRRRAGLVAGLALGTWLSISLEGLPMVAAMLAFMAIRWAIDPAQAASLRATVAVVAATALAIFVVTHSTAAWSMLYCDAISPVYLAILGIAAIGVGAISALPLGTPIVRLGMLALVGIAALAPIPLIAPACAAGPFAQLDPLVHDLWYLGVLEGLPIWQQDVSTAVNSIGLPIVGLIGAAIGARTTAGVGRSRWVTLLVLGAAATATAILVQRSSGLANVLAIPGAVRLIHPLLLSARTIASLPKRIAATAGVIMIGAPGVAASTSANWFAPDPMKAETRAATIGCLAVNDLSSLGTLPRSTILAPLDMSPAILLLTPHSAIASGHHRGGPAMHDVIAAFAGTVSQARAVIVRHKVGYVAFCPGLAETQTIESLAPLGFMAQLDRGRVPAWLTPVRLDNSPVKVWRVGDGAPPTKPVF